MWNYQRVPQPEKWWSESQWGMMKFPSVSGKAWNSMVPVTTNQHKPSMTGNGLHTTYKNGDFPGAWFTGGMVIFHHIRIQIRKEPRHAVSDAQQLNQLGDLQEKIAIGVVGVAVVVLHHVHEHFLQPAEKTRWVFCWRWARKEWLFLRKAMFLEWPLNHGFTCFTPPF